MTSAHYPTSGWGRLAVVVGGALGAYLLLFVVLDDAVTGFLVWIEFLAPAAGLSGIRFHDTRHTAATRASKKLSNVMELAAFTGHRSLQSLKRYYHPDAQDLAAKLG